MKPLVYFFALCVLFSRLALAQTGDYTAGKVFSEAKLISNFVERGITQSDRGLALQTGFGYQWTQFRAGLWGSNVKYLPYDDTLNLRLHGIYRFIISPNADLSVRYDISQYFKAGDHNGNITSVDFQMFGYHVKGEKNSNFEASYTTSTRYSLGKDWVIFTDSSIETYLSYTNVSDAGLKNFFDVYLAWKIKWQDFSWALAVTHNTTASQFGDRADTFVIGSMGVSF